MSAYQPPTFSAPIDLDLSKNEGMPTIDRLDLDQETVATLTSRYPDTGLLTALLAERLDVPESRVLVTAGGDDALFRCFLRNEGTIVATTPSFEMISRYASQTRRELVEIPWWDGDFPVAEFVAAGADMAVIVSPNNPTGSVCTRADLIEVAAAIPFVVLDAAYVEFADEDLTATALELENVAVVRTLSKAFGLAGLRVGYLLGSTPVVDALRGYGSPYSLSSLSGVLASDVLARVSPHPYVQAVRENRRRLFGLLETLGAQPLPSQGNFVLARAVDPDWLVAAAASLGVAFRHFPDRPGLDTCVRITVPGDDDGYERLESALRSALAPEAIVFDMDGVLADVGESYRAAIVETAAGYGVDVSAAQVATAKAAGDASDDWELTRRLIAAAGTTASLEDVRERFEAIYQGTDGHAGLKLAERLLPDPALLEKWSSRLPLGIVTGRPRSDAEFFLERFDIARHFSAVVTREDARMKPDPAPVRLALEQLGVSGGWMVGDTHDDMVAARLAGVVPIGVKVRGDDPGALCGAARILDVVDELEEVLDGTQR